MGETLFYIPNLIINMSANRTSKVGSVDLPDSNDDEVIEALASMRAITPSQVANRFDIKVSIAKKFLKKLHEDGRIRLETKNQSLKVYSMPG